ncbi:type II secretion system F family protein [Ruminococcaceae bacterium OttesenSCG-928-A16]|nr:type II secretion system F family protein [Ruminococcaceae bacterium OttesenSCG-928-A16]
MPEKMKIQCLPPQELAVFFESMSMLLHTGVIAGEAPGIIEGDVEPGKLKTACQRLNEILESQQAHTVSAAMHQSGLFPEYSVEMYRIGEASGRLETISQLLSRFYRRQDIVNSNVRGAIGGPILLLAMMSIVLFFLILYVLPVFQGVFNSLGASSAGGMQMAFTASRIAMAVVGVLLLGVITLLVLYLIPATKQKVLQFCSILPPVRRIMYMVSAGRFTQGLAMLMASGIGAPEALDRATALVQDKTIQKNLPACKKMVEEGEDIGKALVASGVLVGFEARVLLSAARAGQTSIVLSRLAEHYAQQADAGIEGILSMLEPALVGILSVAIGVILLSVMLPLTGVMSAIQ